MQTTPTSAPRRRYPARSPLGAVRGDKHEPRVCRGCHAPMAGDEVTCRRCGVQWAAEDGPRTMLRLVSAGAPSTADPDTERWINEGGSIAAAARG